MSILSISILNLGGVCDMKLPGLGSQKPCLEGVAEVYKCCVNDGDKAHSLWLFPMRCCLLVVLLVRTFERSNTSKKRPTPGVVALKIRLTMFGSSESYGCCGCGLV